MNEDLTDSERRERAHACMDRLHRALIDHDMDAFAGQWASDGSMNFPFAPPGWPTLSSREEVRSYLSGYTERINIQGIRHQRRHDTADPDHHRRVGRDGAGAGQQQPVRHRLRWSRNRQRDGITSYRDYWSALAAGAALGSLDTMKEAFKVNGTN